MGFNVSRLFYSKPQTLGEGMRRVVKYASKGAKEATHTVKHTPGLRVYNNGVGVYSQTNGFIAKLENGMTEHIGELADKSNKISDIKRYAKAANGIGRGRVKEGNTEIVTDFFGRSWKAIQRFFKKDAVADKMYAKKSISLPNDKSALDAFDKKYFA